MGGFPFPTHHLTFLGHLQVFHLSSSAEDSSTNHTQPTSKHFSRELDFITSTNYGFFCQMWPKPLHFSTMGAFQHAVEDGGWWEAMGLCRRGLVMGICNRFRAGLGRFQRATLGGGGFSVRDEGLSIT